MTITLESRYRKATNEIRKNGIVFKTNVMSCCRGCVNEHDLGIEDDVDNYGYTFGGQKKAVTIKGDNAYYRDDKRKRAAQRNYINFGSTDTANKIVEIFNKHGIVTQWNGNDTECIIIRYDASV